MGEAYGGTPLLCCWLPRGGTDSATSQLRRDGANSNHNVRILGVNAREHETYCVIVFRLGISL